MIEDSAKYTEYVGSKKTVLDGNGSAECDGSRKDDSREQNDFCRFMCQNAHITDRGKLICEIDGLEKIPHNETCPFADDGLREIMQDRTATNKTNVEQVSHGMYAPPVKTGVKTQVSGCEHTRRCGFGCPASKGDIISGVLVCMIDEARTDKGRVCPYTQDEVNGWCRNHVKLIKNICGERAEEARLESIKQNMMGQTEQERDGSNENMRGESAIKDSGQRHHFESGAVRDLSSGKGDMVSIPWEAVLRLSRHYENGAKKYDRWNFRKGINLSSYIDSACRHLAKYQCGCDDEDHLAAAAFNVLGAMLVEEIQPELIDLPTRAGKNRFRYFGSEHDD